MKKNNMTVVTGLWDIQRGELPSGFARTFQHYKECFARLLAVDYPMVIFTSSDMNSFIMEHRKPENTRIINKSLEDIKNYYPWYDKVQQIRVTTEWRNQASWIVDSPQSQLSHYVPIVGSKMFMVHDACCMNPFGHEYFMWIDSAISNTVGNPQHWLDAAFESKLIAEVDKKILFLNFPYDENAPEVHGFTKTILDQLCGIKSQYVCRGGLFAGHRDALHVMNDLYYQLHHTTINNGLLGTEESLFTILSYQHPDKIRLHPIEGNGLIYKFLEDLKNKPIPKVNEFPFAWYFLTFNTPGQFEYTLQKWKDAYPNDFNRAKKYVVNNSNNPEVESAYEKLFSENNIEVIHKGQNLGINSARRFVAQHFDKSDHDYYMFIEEDMGVYEKEKDPSTCKNGFTTYHENLLDYAVEIFKTEKLDFLKLTFTEFFGDNFCDWGYINAPREKKDIYCTPREDMLETKTYSPNTVNKPKIKHLGVFKDLPFVVGSFHIDNWPIICSKEGSRKVYLDIKWTFEYEQTFMSLARDLWEQGKISIGCLLASPILHNRITHYDGAKRRENETYTN